MLTKRIIPCLDVKDGRTVKGINFINLRDAGDPVELGKVYSQQGADELVFLDITATLEKRKTLVDLVCRVARNINIPFTIGGGISSKSDVSACLHAGADKVSINTAAVKRPELVDALASEFGSQCIVVAIDTRKMEDGSSKVYTYGGSKPTEIDTFQWAREVTDRGAGEILLTSMNHGGTKSGFANELTRELSEMLSIPIIASGGAGEMKHFVEVFKDGKADAALAASIFHYREIGIWDLKKFLQDQGINMRI